MTQDKCICVDCGEEFYTMDMIGCFADQKKAAEKFPEDAKKRGFLGICEECLETEAMLEKDEQDQEEPTAEAIREIGIITLQKKNNSLNAFSAIDARRRMKI